MTHDVQLWINLLLFIGFFFAAFSVGGFIIERQEKKEELAEAKRLRHQDDDKKQEFTDQVRELYIDTIIYEIKKH